MKLFIDSANPDDLRAAFSHGLAQGCTTNPALISKEPPHRQGYLGHLRDLTRACPDLLAHPLSVQPPIEELRASPVETVGRIKGHLQTRLLAIKIPMSWENLPLIRLLAGKVPVNVTCVFAPEQAIAAISAGARYVSFFWGRMNDAAKMSVVDKARLEIERREQCDLSSGYNPGGPEAALKLIRSLIDQSPARVNTEIIAGSIRSPADAMAAFAAGAHIVTTKLSVLQSMAWSPLSDASATEFSTAFAVWDEASRNLPDEEPVEAEIIER